jgi:hypothetical protein
VRNLPNALRVLYYRVVKNTKYPYVLDFGTHKEVYHYSITPCLRANVLEKGVQDCLKADGVLVVAVHYHAFQKRIVDGERIGDVLHRLVDRVSARSDIRFSTYEDIWGRA